MKKQNIQSIRRSLIEWYNANKRDLPWRRNTDPYRIWVSEVMLQQTQVKTVIPYFESFIASFPYVRLLAQAAQERVLKSWEGMGYYARARNLHRAAQRVCEFHGGQIPDNPVAFKALPGVGDYICAAVQSIAFGAPMAVVDGNVKRVLSRLFEIAQPVNRPSSSKAFAQAADGLLDRTAPGLFNQAVMELGALVCKPSTPSCGDCPLSVACAASRSGLIRQFPVRDRRGPVPLRRVAVGVVEKDGRILLTRRRPDGLLGGLWEFPGGKVEAGEKPVSACAREIREETGLDVAVTEHIARVKHAYTHFKVEIDVYRCSFQGGKVVLDGPVDYRWIALEEVDRYPLPKASHKILPHLKNRL